jgi:ribosome-binding protein aMBF1 (putative translation factor)
MRSRLRSGWAGHELASTGSAGPLRPRAAPAARTAALSQEHLAHKAEINRSYLGEVERGSAVPSLATMSKLASALDMRLSNLLAICEQDTAG